MDSHTMTRKLSVSLCVFIAPLHLWEQKQIGKIVPIYKVSVTAVLLLRYFNPIRAYHQIRGVTVGVPKLGAIYNEQQLN
jgi:hypothetical protein